MHVTIPRGWRNVRHLLAGAPLIRRLALTADSWILANVSKAEIVRELESLPPAERAEVIKGVLVDLWPESGKAVERLIRRLENPDIPEDVWRGIEEAEDGQFIDMDEALSELDRP